MPSFKKKGKKAIERRPVLARNTKEAMLACVIRNQQVFLIAKDLLTPQHFGVLDAGFALVYTVVTRFFEKYGKLPDYELLRTGLQAEIETGYADLTEKETEALDDFLEYAFDESQSKYDSDSYVKWGVDQIQLYLEEVLAREAQDHISTGDQVAANLTDLFQGLQQKAETFATLTHKGVEVPFPEGWDLSGGVTLASTGVGFLDNYLGGGHAVGEAYVVLGPHGSCKTTLAVMLTVEASRFAWAQTRKSDWDGRVGVAIHVSYEAPKAELRLRSLSYAARIRRSSVERMGPKGLAALGTSEDLRAYEKQMFRRQLAVGSPVLGEQERARIAVTQMNRYVLMLDFTGTDPDNTSAGAGLVEEIVRTITAETRRRPEIYPTCIVIDYVGAAVKNYIAAGYGSNDEKRHLLDDFPLKARRQLAGRWQCPVWIFHQLSGAANSRSPGAKLSRTDAAECKTIAENADFCFIVGNKSEDNLCVFHCDKERRRPPMPDTIIRVQGAMNRVLDTSGRYTIDARGKLISVDDATRVSGAGGTAKKTFRRREAKPVPSSADLELEVD